MRQAPGVHLGAATTTPLHRALVLLAVVLGATSAGVVALVAAGPLADVPLAYAFPAGGVLHCATGLLAWWRRPVNRTGALLVTAGVAWLVASLANTAVPVLIAAGTVAAVLPVSVLLHLLHASPGGRLRGRTSRTTVAAAYVVGLVLQAPLWAFTPAPPPYHLLAVAERPDLAQAGFRVQQVVGAVVVAVTVLVLVRRLRAHEPPQRRLLAPLFGYGLLAVVAVPLVANVLSPLLGLGEVTTVTLQLVALLTVPLGFLLVVLRGGFSATRELSAFVTSAASSGTSHRQLQDAVAATLGDPSATLLLRSHTTGAYHRADGEPVPLPGVDGARAAVQVDVGDRRVGAVVYDARLDTDPLAVAAVGRVAALALDREQLAREVSESRQALLETSSRVLANGDQDRRRIAQDLHDGLQVALVRLAVQAHRLAQDLPDGPGATAARQFAAEVDEAAAGLRALVRGVMPPPLVERGLAAAVSELVDDLPVQTSLQVVGVPERLPAPVETTAWFVVAETLTNVLKHAGARTVEVSLRLHRDLLLVDVTDDGKGGAASDGAGSGLTALRDRVEVLGGTFRVDSDTTGTRVRAQLPCG